MRSRLTHEIHRNEDTLDILERVDVMRMDAARKLDTRKRAVLGQYFTPAPIARQMASLFEPAMDDQEIYMLDAGAGVGILFVATVIELLHSASPPKAIHLVAYEIDDVLVEYAYESLRLCQQLCRRAGVHCSGEVLHEDFVASATEALEGTLFSSYVMPTFTHVILNPPYHKIASTSPITNQLHRVGIDTTNLYTGFLALATRLLTFSGQLVAITPRSFCNGPYFKNFRQEFLKEMMLRHIHVFESRQGTFEDDVLQESVILHAIKENSGKNPRVIISSSTTFNDDLILSREVAYEQVLHPYDPESFIHIVPDTAGDQVVESMSRLHTSLEELEIAVSTGRVVDFRAAAFLRRFPGPETVPLIYPTHIENSRVRWPKETKKPNALVHTEEIQTLLVPNGSYVLVKRFSAKEEKRRIVAALYDANDIATTYVGFENHLNYFHAYGKGLPLLFAKGLVMFLNSTLVDAYFRHFNGHTQVNATDLRNIHYPTQDQLERLGAKVATQFPEQAILDELVERAIWHV